LLASTPMAATRYQPRSMAVRAVVRGTHGHYEEDRGDEADRLLLDLACEADEVTEVLGPEGLKRGTGFSGDIAEHLETRDRRNLKQVG
jgi:hypothetical protein